MRGTHKGDTNILHHLVSFPILSPFCFLRFVVSRAALEFAFEFLILFLASDCLQCHPHMHIVIRQRQSTHSLLSETGYQLDWVDLGRLHVAVAHCPCWATGISISIGPPTSGGGGGGSKGMGHHTKAYAHMATRHEQ